MTDVVAGSGLKIMSRASLGQCQGALAGRQRLKELGVAIEGRAEVEIGAWLAATVTRASGGQFTAAFNAPLTLRQRAADSAGSQITETITGGYQTAP